MFNFFDFLAFAGPNRFHNHGIAYFGGEGGELGIRLGVESVGQREVPEGKFGQVDDFVDGVVKI